MLEGLGGFQVRYQKLVPLNASNKVPKETEDIHKGFQFLKQHGPQENSDGQFTSWTEEQVNNPDSILYKWDRGTIKEFPSLPGRQGRAGRHDFRLALDPGRLHSMGSQHSVRPTSALLD